MTKTDYTDFFYNLHRHLMDSQKDYRLIANYSNEDGAHKCWEYNAHHDDEDGKILRLYLVNDFRVDSINVRGEDIVDVAPDDWGYTIKLKNGYTLELEIYQRINPNDFEA